MAKTPATTNTEPSTSEDQVLSCPQRREHAQRIGQVCAACETAIPGGGYYSPEQYRLFFGNAIVEPPRGPFSYSDEEAETMREYDSVRALHEQAAFEVANFEHQAAVASREKTDGAALRLSQVRASLPDLIRKREALRDLGQQLLIKHTNLGISRTNRKLIAEQAAAAPAPDSDLGQRILAAIRGR